MVERNIVVFPRHLKRNEVWSKNLNRSYNVQANSNRLTVFCAKFTYIISIFIKIDY